MRTISEFAYLISWERIHGYIFTRRWENWRYGMILKVLKDLMLKLKSTVCLISANTSVPQVLSLVIGLSIDYSCRGWWLVWCWKWSPVCAKLTACCRRASSQLLLQSTVWFDYSHLAGMGFAEGVNKVVWILFFIILPSFAASLYITSSWYTVIIVVCCRSVWI